jgi:hypothetical protein
VIVGGASLKAAPAARQDDAEKPSIIVNGRKGLYEHGHRGSPAVPESNATPTWGPGFLLGGKVHVTPARSIFTNALNFRFSLCTCCRHYPGAATRCLSSWRYRHFSRLQSSSASRFTAGAFGFFILSKSGERPER